MKTKILVVLLGLVFISGCDQSPEISSDFQPPKIFSPEIETLRISEDGAESIFLSSPNFAGKLVIFSEKTKKQNSDFVLPIFLENVQKSDKVDTVTLQISLPTKIKFKKIISPAGFSAEIDGANSEKPTIYFHSAAMDAGNYSPVFSRESEPIFSIVFSGENSGQKIAFQGSFFRANGELIHANRQILKFPE